MSITRSTRKAIEMSKDEPGQDAERQESVSAYAPKRAGEPYLTEAMIAPSGNMNLGDPIRLTQMAAPALDQIGKATADKIELSALALVENAQKGAETILGEARIQADDMVASAEAQAADLRELARGIRAYSDRKASQVGKFCAVAESILTTVHALGSNFQSMIAEEEAEEADEQKLLPTSLSFLNRKVAIT